jgi:hypothetical protein
MTAGVTPRREEPPWIPDDLARAEIGEREIRDLELLRYWLYK